MRVTTDNDRKKNVQGFVEEIKEHLAQFCVRMSLEEYEEAGTEVGMIRNRLEDLEDELFALQEDEEEES